MSALPAHEHVEVALPTLLTPTVALHCVREAIKFLWFHRMQLPATFDQCKVQLDAFRAAAAHGSRRRVPRGDLKNIAAMEALLQGLDGLFPTAPDGIGAGVYDVVCLFGPTMLNPREVYALRFALVPDSHSGGGNLTEQLKACHNASRALLRTLLAQSLDVFSRHLGPSNFHVLTMAHRNTPPPAIFRPQPRFSLRCRRPLKYLLTLVVGDAQALHTVLAAPPEYLVAGGLLSVHLFLAPTNTFPPAHTHTHTRTLTHSHTHILTRMHSALLFVSC
jgi:hypothetical protein